MSPYTAVIWLVPRRLMLSEGRFSSVRPKPMSVTVMPTVGFWLALTMGMGLSGTGWVGLE